MNPMKMYTKRSKSCEAAGPQGINAQKSKKKTG